jgi:hypothetical protein
VVVFGQGGLAIGCGDMVWASLVAAPLIQVLGWSAEDQQGHPLTLGIDGHLVAALAHRFEDVQNAVTCVDRGLAKEKKGDLDGAVTDFKQAIKLNPKYAFA